MRFDATDWIVEIDGVLQPLAWFSERLAVTYAKLQIDKPVPISESRVA